jgi:hypothetical protein
MVAPELINCIEQLLIDGKLSYRKIARLTGVSRGTVGVIASRRWQKWPYPIRFWEEDAPVSDTPPERCPECGGMVYMPCRLCRARKELAKSPDLRALTRTNARQPFTPIGLNLKPAHRERYEQVRRWRREQAKGSAFGGQGAGLEIKTVS